MISQEKLKILTHLQKLPMNVGDLGNLIVAKGFKKLPKVQQITQSSHTASLSLLASPRVSSVVRDKRILGTSSFRLDNHSPTPIGF